jgi:hypothetical protein
MDVTCESDWLLALVCTFRYHFLRVAHLGVIDYCILIWEDSDLDTSREPVVNGQV